jgi:excisionase family DNA binding protein
MPNSIPLSAAQASEQTGFPKRTILHAIKKGWLPAKKLDGYIYLIDQDDLDRWAAARVEKTA